MSLEITGRFFIIILSLTTLFFPFFLFFSPSIEELGSLQGEYEGVLKDIGTLKEASEAKQKEYSEKIATLKEAEV